MTQSIRRHRDVSRLTGLAVMIAALAGVISACGPGPQAPPSTSTPATQGTSARPAHSTGVRCQNAFVPAFFSPGGYWTQAISSKPPPSVMILDVTSTGAGTAPDPGLQAEVRRAQAAGIKVVGYSSTDYGHRPAAQVEADVRHYKAWYNVTGIFLDLAANGPAQLGYYRGLAYYIRQADPGATIWLNPGNYPDQGYMSVANVIMSFEGPYSTYAQQKVPSWAYHYPATRFAHTVFATPGSQLASAVSLAKSRNAGYVYVTDDVGSNPYDAMPSYWTQEDTVVKKGCTGG